MHYICEYRNLKIKDFNLCVAILNNEYGYNIIGILNEKKKIKEYCKTIEFYNRSFIYEIFGMIIKELVFPHHFYNLIDDL